MQNLNSRRIPGLDGLRGFAALAVVGFHDQVLAHPGSSRLLFPGRFAVQIFFVISGILITWLLLQEESRQGAIDRPRFYWRRAFRLLPALFALLLWQRATHIPPATRGGMLASAFYFGNYYELIAGSAVLSGLGQMWSLAVEEHFYVFWPQVFATLRNKRTLLRGCLAVIALQLVWRLIAGWYGHFVYAELATETASSAILAGCATALLLRQHPQRLPRILLAPWMAPVSFAAILLLAQLPRNAQLWWAVPLGIPFAIVLVLQAITYQWRILENPVSIFLGRISYSVYLWGMVAIALVERLRFDWGRLPVLAVAVLLGSVSYFIVERPFQFFGKQWLTRGRGKLAFAAE